MHITAHLDLDLIALDEENQVTCLLELTAPADERVAERPARTLVVVLDRSGSMSGEPLEAARTSIESLARRLGQGDCFGLVVFDDDAQVTIPVRPMADHNLEALIHTVRGLRPGGSTNLSGGYLLALREVKASLATTGHTSATLLLLSDGHANAGEVDPQRMHDVARSAVSDSIVTSTVGLGLDYDEVLLDAMTRGGNGTHRFAETVDVASAEIAQTVSDLLDVSVLAATLRITPSDAAVNRITVRHDVPHWADDRSVVVALGDLYSGEQRRLLVQLGVEAVRELGTRPIAELQLQFTSAVDLAEHRITMPIVVNVVPGDEARGVLPNPVVEVERLILEVDETKKAAAEALRNYDPETAASAIADAVQKVSSKRNEAANISEEVAARLDETLAELRDFEVSLETMPMAFNSKMFTESMAESRGKTSRRKPRPNAPDPSEDEL